jgi:hypothetical protein
VLAVDADQLLDMLGAEGAHLVLEARAADRGHQRLVGDVTPEYRARCVAHRGEDDPAGVDDGAVEVEEHDWKTHFVRWYPGARDVLLGYVRSASARCAGGAAFGGYYLWRSGRHIASCAPEHATVPAAAQKALAAYTGWIRHTVLPRTSANIAATKVVTPSGFKHQRLQGKVLTTTMRGTLGCA